MRGEQAVRTLDADHSLRNEGDSVLDTRGTLDLELGRLRLVPPGARRSTLRSVAYRLGQLARQGQVEWPAIECQLLGQALDAGLDEDDARSVIRGARVASIAGPEDPEHPVRVPTNARAAPALTRAGRTPRGRKGLPVSYLDLDAYAVNGIPPISWLLPGWLVEGDIAILAGAASIGKSTTVAALAVALASGSEWCGITPTTARRVLLFDEEQGEQATARLFLRLGAPHPNLRVASGQGIRLDSDEGVARLQREIVAFNANVVVIDSVQQAFGTADENSATEIGAVYQRVFRLRDMYEVTFLLVHHKRKSNPDVRQEALELVRGSTAHGTQASTVWYASSGDAGRSVNIVQAKRRGATKTSLTVAYHEDGEDGPITLSGEGAVRDPETAVERASELIVAYLAGHGTAKRAAILKAAKAGGFSEAALDRALKHLKRVKRVEQSGRGIYTLRGESNPQLGEAPSLTEI